jgi:hypothetical protein
LRIDREIIREIRELKKRPVLNEQTRALVDLLELLECGPAIGITDLRPYEEALVVNYQKWKYGLLARSHVFRPTTRTRKRRPRPEPG